MAAEPEGANCDARYNEYLLSQGREDQLFKVLMLMVLATAVLVIIAVLMVIFGGQSTQVASGGVALVSSIGAGALATMYWRTHRETVKLMNAWIKACPDKVGPTLAMAI
jgi:peptidoglycan/LPS O-acetylase OafA/YrhL